MSYDNSNSGALFKSDKRSGHEDTDRDYSGNAEITCPHCNKSNDFWLSAWINESRAGMKYMKLKFNPKEERTEKPTQRRELNDDGDGFDDIPF